jgi:CRISPR system Cascade subunit CasE
VTTLLRITLNPRHRLVHRDLADAHAMHRRVLSLLPDDLGPDPRAATSTLYRLEETSTGPRLLVQTAGPVQYDRLPDHYTLDIAALDLDQLLPYLTQGTTVRYAITANPAKRAATGPLTGRRVALVGYDAIHAWWQHKATTGGLDITDQPTSIAPAPAATGRRTRGTTTDQISHRVARIEGTATITDPQALTNALTHGIGAGKAHGLGLLTVIPTARPAASAMA